MQYECNPTCKDRQIGLSSECVGRDMRGRVKETGSFSFYHVAANKEFIV